MPEIAVLRGFFVFVCWGRGRGGKGNCKPATGPLKQLETKRPNSYTNGKLGELCLTSSESIGLLQRIKVHQRNCLGIDQPPHVLMLLIGYEQGAAPRESTMPSSSTPFQRSLGHTQMRNQRPGVYDSRNSTLNTT